MELGLGDLIKTFRNFMCDVNNAPPPITFPNTLKIGTLRLRGQNQRLTRST